MKIYIKLIFILFVFGTPTILFAQSQKTIKLGKNITITGTKNKDGNMSNVSFTIADQNKRKILQIYAEHWEEGMLANAVLDIRNKNVRQDIPYVFDKKANTLELKLDGRVFDWNEKVIFDQEDKTIILAYSFVDKSNIVATCSHDSIKYAALPQDPNFPVIFAKDDIRYKVYVTYFKILEGGRFDASKTEKMTVFKEECLGTQNVDGTAGNITCTKTNSFYKWGPNVRDNVLKVFFSDAALEGSFEENRKGTRNGYYTTVFKTLTGKINIELGEVKITYNNGNVYTGQVDASFTEKEIFAQRGNSISNIKLSNGTLKLANGNIHKIEKGVDLEELRAKEEAERKAKLDKLIKDNAVFLNRFGPEVQTDGLHFYGKSNKTKESGEIVIRMISGIDGSYIRSEEIVSIGPDGNAIIFSYARPTQKALSSASASLRVADACGRLTKGFTGVWHYEKENNTIKITLDDSDDEVWTYKISPDGNSINGSNNLFIITLQRISKAKAEEAYKSAASIF